MRRTGFTLAVSSAMAVVALAVPAPAGAAGTTVCHLTDDRITEASGLVASDQQDDVLFTHNDSGDRARFFAIGTDCATRATYDLPGVTATDWEDIARGPGPGGRTVLWLGDIGDNAADRGAIVVQRVDEPVVPAPSASPPTIDVASTSFVLRYPDGAHDAEALLADPHDGRLYVVTKTYDGRCAVYAAPVPLTSGATLTKVAALRIPPSVGGTSLASLAGDVAVTGGDIAPDGSRVVLRTYASAFEAAIPPGAAGPRLRAAYATGRPGTVIAIPAEEQGEAVAYARDGRSLWLTSEKVHPPLDQVELPTSTPSRPPSPSRSPSARPPVLQVPDEADPHLYRYGGIALAVAAVAVFAFGRRRRRRPR